MSEHTTLSSLFFTHARQTPFKVALICAGKCLSYSELSAQVLRWSQMLDEQGVKRGDALGVLLPNSLEFVVLMLAAANRGIVLVPVHMSLPLAAVRTAFEAGDVRHIVALDGVWRRLQAEADPALQVAGVCLSVGEKVGNVPAVASVFPPQPNASLYEASVGQGTDPYILTMTSGSTGSPKPIVLTQCTKLNRVRAALDLYHGSSQDVVLAATPLYHSLAERLVLIALLQGASLVVMPHFSVSEWIAAVQNHKVSFTMAVSSQLAAVAEHLSVHPPQSPLNLRCLVSSSAPLELPLKQRLIDLLSCDFHECYGTSEVAIASNLSVMADPGKLASVGRAAPTVDVQIIDGEDGVVPLGEPGEIVVRTSMLFGGYYKRPQQTAQAMWKTDYFRTGDLGRLDEEGFLYYLGRSKDLIITGGINVYPADIEAVVTTAGQTSEVAAFALPDERLGEVVAVALVARSGLFNLKALRYHCAAQLADYQQPRRWLILDELPKNSMGKILKSELPSIYRAQESAL